LAIVLYLLPAQNGEIPPETERKIIKIASVAEGKKTIKMPSVSVRSRAFRRKMSEEHSNWYHVPPHKNYITVNILNTEH
jgi:hypothetical protein